MLPFRALLDFLAESQHAYNASPWPLRLMMYRAMMHPD
jgi:hypothetical protein